jgi:hypothetical protein
MKVFQRVIENLFVSEGLNVFSQIPFQEGMVAFYREWRRSNPHPGSYCWPILLEFYAPFFALRKFESFHFIHGYDASIGARWEHGQCIQLGIRRRYLPESLSLECIAA